METCTWRNGKGGCLAAGPVFTQPTLGCLVVHLGSTHLVLQLLHRLPLLQARLLPLLLRLQQQLTPALVRSPQQHVQLVSLLHVEECAFAKRYLPGQNSVSRVAPRAVQK